MLESETKKRRVVQTTTRGDDSLTDDVLRILDVHVLTVLAHPDLQRVGERAFLTELATRALELSRLEPEFARPDGGPAQPLGCGYLSRTPIQLTIKSDGSLLVNPTATKTELVIGGSPVTSVHTVTPQELDRGVVLLLADRIALLLHRIEPPQTPPHFEMVGDSPSMVRLRCLIERLAPRPHTVLLRGETGTGKELVARALHHAGDRRHGPFRAVNLAAIPGELAASELFGAARGAYTGAGAGRDGYFSQASGGTLFLDEIGDAPLEVQVALLRVLETGEVQPVGATQPKRVDVRVIAGTDADLEEAVRQGRFRAPLLHRLSAYQIFVPPLRERRDDISRLFVHFLRRELEAEGRLDRLEPDRQSERAWVPASLIAQLTRFDWPGNVRQLENQVRAWVLDHLDDHEMRPTASLERLIGANAADETDETSPPVAAKPPKKRPAQDLSELEIRQALRQNDFKQDAAAEALGVARTSLIKQMDALGIARAPSLTPEQIQGALEACSFDLAAAARRLEVSEQSLKMRLKALEKHR